MTGLNRRLILCFAALTLLLTYSNAQTLQTDWIVPGTPDTSQTFVRGQTTTIRWTRNLYTWFAEYAKSADVTNVDLWTVCDGHEQKVASGIDVKSTTSYVWTVDIPTNETQSQLSLCAVLFVPSNTTPLTSYSQHIASPLFVVADTSTTNAGGRTAMIVQRQASATAKSSPASAGLSTGAKAGIGIGAGLIVLILAGAFLYIRRKRAHRFTTPLPSEPKPVDNDHHHIEKVSSDKLAPVSQKTKKADDDRDEFERFSELRDGRISAMDFREFEHDGENAYYR